MPLNCGAGENSWESHAQQEIKPVNPKENQPWIFIGRTDAEAPILWPPEPTHWTRLWCWERLKARGDGDDIGWDGWMASATQWTWVWTSSRSWWWTGKPGVLQSMGLQRVTTTKRLNWIDWQILLSQCNICAYCSLPPTVIWDLQPIGLLINLSSTQQMRTKPCLSWLPVQISC